MSFILIVKAKVNISSEDDMELEERDLGIIARSSQWVWRDCSVLTDEIYRVTAYNSTKSILQLYDGEKMLVSESQESLSKRWVHELKELHLFLSNNIKDD